MIMLELTEKEIIEKWDPKDTIKVSICSITYNQEMYIKRALDSFLTQNTSFPFEIIIGDDASSDNTSKILDEYAKNYPKLITVISSPKNIGANANLLQVFNAAQGDYIALCEGDDYWSSENKIDIQYNEMIKNKEVSFSFHSAYINNLQSPIKYKKEKKFFTVDDVLLNHYDQFAPTASYMFKRDIIKIHELQHQWEMFFILEGSLKLTTLDRNGNIIKTDIIGANTPIIAVEISPNEIHSLECLSDKALILEIKEGPFDPSFAKRMI